MVKERERERKRMEWTNKKGKLNTNIDKTTQEENRTKRRQTSNKRPVYTIPSNRGLSSSTIRNGVSQKKTFSLSLSLSLSL